MRFTAIPGSLWESFAESIGADKNNRLLLCDKADPISIEFYIGDVKLVYASKDFIDPYFLVFALLHDDSKNFTSIDSFYIFRVSVVYLVFT